MYQVLSTEMTATLDYPVAQLLASQRPYRPNPLLGRRYGKRAAHFSNNVQLAGVRPWDGVTGTEVGGTRHPRCGNCHLPLPHDCTMAAIP